MIPKVTPIRDASVQEILNATALHLLKQRKASARAEEGEPYQCLYRGDGGLECAVGCFIPDDKYTEALEGKSVGHGPIMKAIGVDDRTPQLNALISLQEIHDNMVPIHWPNELREFAHRFCLSTAVIDKVAMGIE